MKKILNKRRGRPPRKSDFSTIYVEIPKNIREKVDDEIEVSGLPLTKIVENALKRRYDM